MDTRTLTAQVEYKGQTYVRRVPVERLGSAMEELIADLGVPYVPMLMLGPAIINECKAMGISTVVLDTSSDSFMSQGRLRRGAATPYELEEAQKAVDTAIFAAAWATYRRLLEEHTPGGR